MHKKKVSKYILSESYHVKIAKTRNTIIFGDFSWITYILFRLSFLNDQVEIDESLQNCRDLDNLA